MCFHAVVLQHNVYGLRLKLCETGIVKSHATCTMTGHYTYCRDSTVSVYQLVLYCSLELGICSCLICDQTVSATSIQCLNLMAIQTCKPSYCIDQLLSSVHKIAMLSKLLTWHVHIQAGVWTVTTHNSIPSCCTEELDCKALAAMRAFRELDPTGGLRFTSDKPSMKQCPVQQNDTDCGMFTAGLALAIATKTAPCAS